MYLKLTFRQLQTGNEFVVHVGHFGNLMAIMSRRFKTIEVISAELACCIFEEIVNESIDNLTSYSLKGWISELHAGKRTSAQELRHKFRHEKSAQTSARKISLTSAHVIFLHGAEVNIPIELGAEVNIGCRSPQVGAEGNLCRSYSCRTSIASTE